MLLKDEDLGTAPKILFYGFRDRPKEEHDIDRYENERENDEKN